MEINYLISIKNSLPEPDLSLHGHTLPIWSLIELKPGQLIASTSADFTIRIWDIKVGKEVNVLKGHTMPVWCVASLSESVIATGSEDAQVKLWDWDTGECIKTMVAHSQAVWSISQDSKGNVATASWDKTVMIWNIKSMKERKK